MSGKLMQIGEVSDRTGLSLRTIRHQEKAGIVAASGRSAGDFRLYTESEVRRLAAGAAYEAAGLLSGRHAYGAGGT
ncbi:MerR family DNA-binding transcriptional regulator [Streptomyces johnsoniae]|uniref:MerR family DNA-binding transcriptional regulator n=1 Tax=Streptomyces johnsoniae TaxID=3075532 RepID=A0ABU2S6S4_9ACTN|nr:MerR family DNA-binding transcriptional regulator [Streptomyces sp. DSM 41886]MDT0444668.1 MerR family DNA-binding transcriptional regulator [Streptomyces sp. DSM 41886]